MIRIVHGQTMNGFLYKLIRHGGVVFFDVVTYITKIIIVERSTVSLTDPRDIFNDVTALSQFVESKCPM